MVDLSLAIQLRDIGLIWHPQAGDSFVITSVELVDEVFHLADMVIESRTVEAGTIFAFNGTTEWALDSVDQADTVWLPHEQQLRTLLGPNFQSLRRDAGEFLVELSDGSTHRDLDAGNAYALALLASLRASLPAGGH